MRKLSWLIGAAVFWLVSLFLMPMDVDLNRYVPPSELFLNEAFSGKYWYYRHRPAPDFLILGNSRIDAALIPGIIAAELQHKYGRSFRVSSLSTGGGYFPFYQEILTTLLDRNQLPRNIILGVSPRDFNRHESRRFSVAEFLKSSSGYNLRRIPYAEPFHTIEAKLADVSALILPGFFYSSRVGTQLFRQRESLPDIAVFRNFPRIQAIVNKWHKDALMMIPTASGLAALAGFPFPQRIRFYFGRFRTAFGWDPGRMGLVDPDGSNSAKVDYSVFAKRKSEALAKQRALFNPDQAGSPYPDYRYGKDFKPEIDIWDDPAGAPEKTLKFLAKHNVGVYFVLPPAYVLEGWENNEYFNDLLKHYLVDLQKRYPNVGQIIDINNNFDHPFLDPDMYYDMEHAMPDAAAVFSKRLVGLMDLPSRHVRR